MKREEDHTWPITLLIGVLSAIGFLCWVLAWPAYAAEADWRLDRATCHSWEGGHGASGSFSACPPVLVTVTNTVERERVVTIPAPPAAPLAVQECPVFTPPPPKVSPAKPRPKVKPAPVC